MKIAVYGTLKKNNHNHRFLAGSKYIGNAEITGYDMYCIGTMKYGMGYPYLVPSDSKELIEVEVYEIGSYVYNTIKVIETGYDEQIILVKVGDVEHVCIIYVALEDTFRFDREKRITHWDGSQ
jgi:gamma-glutamylcyclotransferase (GGCT)/AIG2-like uncharacterized protein YtfP